MPTAHYYGSEMKNSGIGRAYSMHMLLHKRMEILKGLNQLEYTNLHGSIALSSQNATEIVVFLHVTFLKCIATENCVLRTVNRLNIMKIFTKIINKSLSYCHI
jgi:hypothetical protein